MYLVLSWHPMLNADVLGRPQHMGQCGLYTSANAIDLFYVLPVVG